MASTYMTLTSDKSKRTALILCAIGGMFGVHDFYLGKIGVGLFKLFTCNRFCIGWIIDLIKIASGSYTDSAGVPLRA